jgi:hypothetical protein
MTYCQGETDQHTVLFSAMKGEVIMRRIFLGTGTLFLGLAALMWATAPSSAQRGGGGRGGGGHGGGGHAPAPVGSVHYAARPAPARVAPVRVVPAVGTATVRSEHYAGSPSRGAYRNPYREEYSRHFRAGYLSFVIGDASYYYYDDLPPDYQTVVNDGITYYLFDGVYYQPYIYEGQTVYMVVPVPG